MDHHLITTSVYLVFVVLTLFLVKKMSDSMEEYVKEKSKFIKQNNAWVEISNELISEHNDVVKFNHSVNNACMKLLEHQNKIHQKIAILRKLNPDNKAIDSLYQDMIEAVEDLRKKSNGFLE